MDYSNQLKIFNPQEYEEKSVSIVGVGAIGSFTAIVLSKMGIKNINVYDGDTIEEHNIPNQFYKLNQIEKEKTEALKELIGEFAETNIIQNGVVDDKSVLVSDIVIVCTDNMESRKLAYNLSKKFATFFIDARMNGHTYRVYTLNLKDKNHTKEYEKTLYSDGLSDEGQCTEKTIIYNVVDIASKIGNQIRKVLNEQKYTNFLAYDFQNDHLIKKVWGEKCEK